MMASPADQVKPWKCAAGPAGRLFDFAPAFCRIARFLQGDLMAYITWFVDFFLHLDKHLAEIIQQFGTLTYGILFTIIFCETGLVFTPILPGDSLLFAAGTFAALGQLNVWVMFGLLSLAAVLGDTVNYWVGHYLGPKVFSYRKSRWFNPEHLKKTHEFYERHGGKTIIIARFMPIVRTFAPFVAGIGAMTYSRFIIYNVVGGVAWVAAFVFGGYKFAGNEVVRKNFTLVIIAIVFISILPGIIAFVKAKYFPAKEIKQ
jgi:membrane-associated protein